MLRLDSVGAQQNFFDLGGDSFSAIRVVREFHPTLPVSAIFAHPTLAGLAAAAAAYGPESARPLLTALRAAENPGLTVVAVPYGGGNAVSYTPLAQALPVGMSLYAVALPGHEFDGTPLESLPETADRLCQEVIALPGPVMLYGQCAGSALTVALTRRLCAAGHPPHAVFVGASLVNPDPLGAARRDAAMTDEQVLGLLEGLGGLDGDLLSYDRAAVVRLVRHDLRESAQYFGSVEGAPAPVRAYCVIGANDPATFGFRDRYRDWSRHFAQVSLIELPGAGHYFNKSHPRSLGAELVRLRPGKELSS